MISERMYEWYRDVSSNRKGIVLIDRTIMPEFIGCGNINLDPERLHKITKLVSPESFLASKSSRDNYNSENDSIKTCQIGTNNRTLRKKLDFLVRERKKFIENIGVTQDHLSERIEQAEANSDTLAKYFSIEVKDFREKAVRGACNEIVYALEIAQTGKRTMLCTADLPLLNVCRQVFGDRESSPLYQMYRPQTIENIRLVKVEKEKGWMSTSATYVNLIEQFNARMMREGVRV